MRTQCCQPPFGSVQCQDCPLTVPLYSANHCLGLNANGTPYEVLEAARAIREEDDREMTTELADKVERIGLEWHKGAILSADDLRSIVAALRKPAPEAQRVLLATDPYCPSCGHNRDKSSVSTINRSGLWRDGKNLPQGSTACQICGAEWVEVLLPQLLRPEEPK